MDFAARLLGTGSAHPEKRLTNDDIAAYAGGLREVFLGQPTVVKLLGNS